jgi:GTP-binding protein
MDHNDIEKERGITILSKCTSITYNDYKINIVDTPGHSDFGGEVERVLNMVDGVCLVVCSNEGPMPQTKFVLEKALKNKLKPIVVINKVDRETSRPLEVQNDVFDLFCNLGASEEQLDYPVLFASAKNKWATTDLKTKSESIIPLIDTIISHIPSPKISTHDPLTMLISQTESNSFTGRTLIGRIYSGTINIGDNVQAVSQDGKTTENGKITKIIKRYGMNNVNLQSAIAGDIVSIVGLDKATVGFTINSPGKTIIIPSHPVEPPMLSIRLRPNDSPFFGKEGSKFTFAELNDRIKRECDNDVSLKADIDSKMKDSLIVKGRGDLHLGVLFEKMRREGYEMTLSPPQILYKTINGKLYEPFEEVTIDVGEEYTHLLVEKMNMRKAHFVSSVEKKDKHTSMTFIVATRGLIGLRNDLMSSTKGTIIFQKKFLEYRPYCGNVKKTNKGPIISMNEGKATAYAIKDLEEHGKMFISPGSMVYTGMVIGENEGEHDIECNPCKLKRLTNVRAKNHEEQIRLSPAQIFTIDEATAYIRDDELVEVTPKSIRLRKEVLDTNIRRKQKRDTKNQDIISQASEEL